MRTVFFTHSISEALNLKNKLYDSSQSRYLVILQRPEKKIKIALQIPDRS